MNNIIDEIRIKIKNIDSIYEYPNDSDFHMLRFSEIDWPSPKDSNFFHIIRSLIIKGPLSITGLASLHTDSDHPYDSVFQTIYRLLNGSPNKSNISLQQRGLIRKNKRLFELTPFGVLYAIHVFHMNKYYDDNHNQFTETVDFSYQNDVKGIFDFVKKHYNYFPLFFDNLDLIKASKDININIFFDILRYDITISNTSFFSFYKYDVLNFAEKIQQIIPFAFYHTYATNYMLKFKKYPALDEKIKPELMSISESMLSKMKDAFEFYNGINSEFFS